MRRFLLALLMTLVVASLQAITINWQIYASEFTWDQNLTTADSVYFVYSQSGDLSAADVSEGNYTGYKVSAAANGAGTVTAVGGAASVTGLAPTLSVFGTGEAAGSKSYASMSLNGTGFGSGYFYLVVFNTNADDVSEYDDYAVSKAVQYTAGQSNKENGIYDTTVDGGAPEIGDFVEVSWVGGTWQSALVPEPTALALLALGIAGVALRRKI